MKTKDILEDVGLTANEVKVYLSLLENGPLTIQELSRKTAIHRVNLYETIKNLERKGGVSFEVKGAYRKKIIPNNPRHLLVVVEERGRALKKTELKFKEVMPELIGMMRQSKETISIRYFEGLSGAQQVFNDTLTATTEIKGFSSVDILHEYIPKEWMDGYRKRKSEAGLKGYFIVPEGHSTLSYVHDEYRAYGLTNVPKLKTLPSGLFNVLAEMDIYDDKLSIISMSRQEQMGIIIQSRIVARSFESIFDVLWQFAKKVT